MITHSQRKIMFCRNEKFTLVEMLVVIAILLILAGLLLPALENALESSRGIACLNNHRQTALACGIYVNDNLRFPTANMHPNKTSATATDDDKRVRWWRALGPYVNPLWPAGCLEAVDKNYAAREPVWGCPSAEADRKTTNITHTGMNTAFDADAYGLRAGRIKSASRTLLMADRKVNCNWSLMIGLNTGVDYYPAPRHNGLLVSSYCDGHARMISDWLNSAQYTIAH